MNFRKPKYPIYFHQEDYEAHKTILPEAKRNRLPFGFILFVLSIVAIGITLLLPKSEANSGSEIAALGTPTRPAFASTAEATRENTAESNAERTAEATASVLSEATAELTSEATTESTAPVVFPTLDDNLITSATPDLPWNVDTRNNHPNGGSNNSQVVYLTAAPAPTAQPQIIYREGPTPFPQVTTIVQQIKVYVTSSSPAEPTATRTPTVTPTTTNTPTFTPSATASSTPTPTNTATNTPTATWTASFTPTFTATWTSSPTPTWTPTATFTPTYTSTPLPAVAAYTVTHAGGTDFNFINQSTNASTFFWDFGDGTSTQEFSPRHSYNTAGSFTITLHAYNSAMEASTFSGTLTIPPAPTALFSANTGTDHPLMIQLTNQSMNATSYFWDFGDDSGSQEQQPQHQYSAPGTYTITLRAYNTLMQESAYSGSITLSLPAVANFSITVSEASPLMVLFTNLSQNANTYFWDFGDGTANESNTVAQPEHIYSAPGQYTVILTAYGSTNEDSKTLDISMGETP